MLFRSVDSSKLEEVYLKNVEQNKSLFDKEGINIADKINTICWNIYEKMPTNKLLVTKSLVWIQRAMHLTEYDATEWCAIADTYAHLLQVSGNKKEAINITKQAIEKATQAKMKDVDSYKKYLKELEK